ncbi:MAG TPA: hypothetical protein VFD30_07975 [Terriglobia bacterium]|jgi:hypothetical protein|nr:hypothetical protein [Terriglobia bacterium]
MKRIVALAGICLVLMCVAVFALAGEKKPKGGKLTGTWDCMSHGSSQGDMPFTLYLEQNKEEVTGSVSSPIGGTQINSGTFRKNMLEIQIMAPGTTYTLTAVLKKGQLSGTWSSDTEKGSWEGKKQASESGK